MDQPMTMQEFKRYRKAVVNAQSITEPSALWLVLKRTGPGKSDFSPIGKAIFRGMALPFKFNVDWRNYRIYVALNS